MSDVVHGDSSSLHTPVCRLCGEAWPCRGEMIERQATAFRQRLNRSCAHCGQEVKTGSHSISGNGRVYHTAKSRYPDCRKAAFAFFNSKPISGIVQ